MCPAVIPTKQANTHNFTYPEGVQDWDDLGDWLQNDMDGLPIADNVCVAR